MTLFQNCQSQTKENPKFLGSENGIFDFDKVTFKENIDTLFSKVKNEYYKNQIKDNGQLIGSQVFYDIESNKATNIFFIDENYKATKPIFIVDKNNVFFMISSSFKTDFPPVKIFERINNKFKKYNVKLKSTDKPIKFINGKRQKKLLYSNILKKVEKPQLSLESNDTFHYQQRHVECSINHLSLNLLPIL